MKIKLCNIGKIQNTEVTIDGITVIAGENNTGKSTVSKALYAMFNSFYQVQKQIKDNKYLSISDSIQRLLFHNELDDISFFEFEDTINQLLNEDKQKQIKSNSAEIKEMLNSLVHQSTFFNQDISDEISEVSSRIQDVLSVSDEEIIRTMLTNKLLAEFKGQICNVFTEKTGSIELDIRQQKVVATIHNDIVEETAGIKDFSLLTEAVYIDDPFVLDGYGFTRGKIRNRRYSDHRNDIQRKLWRSDQNKNVVDQIIARRNFGQIYQIISSVCDGEMIINQRGEAVYRRLDNDKYLDIRNLSSGLKTFVILKTLFENGVIENKGTIILDEPEIHLHPEWQLVFAELIVLMQQQFDIHILLNTHSPYFLRALQVYAGKYGIADRCRYYLAESNGESAQINEVSDNIEKIYKKLYRPLQDLENVEWNDD